MPTLRKHESRHVHPRKRQGCETGVAPGEGQEGAIARNGARKNSWGVRS